MKTLKTITICALVAAFTFGTVSNTFGAPPNPNPQTCYPNCPQPSNPNPQSPNPPASPGYHHHRGASWGAFAGGTALGLMMGAMANQPKQTTQPTVVVVQQPNGDNTKSDQYLEQEIEQERAKRLALELELERIKAQHK